MTRQLENNYPTEEVDLYELFQSLWASKLLILLIMGLVTCLAAAYAFFSAPVYQTSVYLLPPTTSDLVSYNVASQLTGQAIGSAVPDSANGIAPLSTREAYRTFLRHLNSNSVRQNFFNEYYLPAQLKNSTEADIQTAWERLNEELTIEPPTKSDDIEARVTLEGENSQLIAEWANAYVQIAENAATQDILNSLTSEVGIRRGSLNDQISTLRKSAKLIQQDRITRLKNALAIAESIGLENPLDSAPLLAFNTQGLNTENINSGSLLYLRGARALRAELQQLKEGRDIDAYIPELPNILKKLTLIDSINLNPTSISAVTVDRPAIVPEEPVKPKKALIILLGIVLGGMLATFVVSIRTFLSRGRPSALH